MCGKSACGKKKASVLTALLSKDKDQSVILLDGDLFHIAGLDVKAGGIVKPYPGRKPIIIGFHQKVERGNRQLDKDGYRSAQIKGYGSTRIVFLDEDLEAVPYSCHLNVRDGFTIKEEQIKIVRKEERLIGIPVPEGFEYLKNGNKNFFRNF